MIDKIKGVKEMQELNYFISPVHGIVYVIEDNELSKIENKSIQINNVVFNTGEETTFFDLFNSPVIYLGLYDEFMLFKIGEEVNLFESLTYANAFCKIDESRIMTVYQAGTARDYVYKEVKGVWQWK